MAKSITLSEPLEGLAASSKLLILDFGQIPVDTPRECNIQRYFMDYTRRGINPRAASSRQKFNNRMLHHTGARYLISRYGEDRTSMLADSSIMEEGRMLHLGIDIFAEDLETVYAPCDGTVVRAGREPGDHSFGYYAIVQPNGTKDLYIFFGHLSRDIPKEGAKVRRGEKIATLGDYENNENGGWSRHLHLQMFTELPQKNSLVGYSSAHDFAENAKRYPDPREYFPCLRALQ